MNALVRLESALRAVGIPIDGVSGSQGLVRVDYQTSATAQQRTQGAVIVAAFDWAESAQTTWQNQQDRAAAKAVLASATDAQAKILRAVAMVCLDEINALRAAVTPTLPARTMNQFRNAIANKIDGGTVD